jgi:hypothetical protein
MYGLNDKELSLLKKLDTPQKIQDFLDSMPTNNEKHGETCMSPRRVLRENKAHCMEGAMLAATALMIQGQKPLIMSLKVIKPDFYHAVVLYKQNGHWGAISKTNHAVLRFRDPIYRSPREIALSYFHEYFLTSNGKKTLRGYSLPVNLRKFGTKWITSEEDLWNITETIYDMSHIDIIPKGSERFIRDAEPLEREAASIMQWQKNDKRT